MEKLDLEHLEQCALSRGYQILCIRIQQMISQKTKALVGDLDPIATAKCRGELAALHTVLNLPSILSREGGVQKVEAIR
jgi:hypothetical protein